MLPAGFDLSCRALVNVAHGGAQRDGVGERRLAFLHEPLHPLPVRLEDFGDLLVADIAYQRPVFLVREASWNVAPPVEFSDS